MVALWEFFEQEDWELLLYVFRHHNVTRIEFDEMGIRVTIDWSGPKSRAIYQRCELC